MGLMQRKQTKLGFALQSTKGEDVTSAGSFTVWRLPEAESLAEDPAYSFIGWADGVGYQNHYFRETQSLSGSVTLWPIPGGSADLIDWMITCAATTGQGKWATFTAEYGNSTRRKFRDCKCASARMEFMGNTTPMWRFDVIGRFGGTGVDISGTAATSVKPYEKHEQKIEVDLGGAGTYSTSTYIHNLTVEVDRQVESAADGSTIAEQLYPEYLANGIPIVTGTLDRRFENSDLWDDFVSGQEGKIRITLTRASVGTVTITLPRVIYTAPGLNAGGDASETVKQEGVPFTALSSADGTTAPITVAET